LWRLTARRWIQVAVHILFVSALILLAEPVYQRVKLAVSPEISFGQALPFWFWTLFGLLILAPLIALWRNLSALAMIIAEAATQEGGAERRLRPLIEFAVRAVAGVVLIVWLLALLPNPGTILGAAGGVLLVLAGVTLVFWRRLVWLHSRLEIELLQQLARASHSTSTSSWSLHQPDAYRDWNLELDEVTVPGDSARAGCTLGALAIRSQFGCSVIGIDRQGYGISNPRADTVLFPRDKMLLLGQKEQVQRAARFLGATAEAGVREGFDDLLMESTVVPAGSPVAGRSLIELELINRLGVQIGAIRRGSRDQVAPAGDERLQEGDELLVLGLVENLRAFENLLAPPVDGEPPSGHPDPEGGAPKPIN
jgi:CPA2 family monovalent cation:H+ antiporter-2